MVKLTREMIRNELLDIYSDQITEEEINSCTEFVAYHMCGDCPLCEHCAIMCATWLMERYKVVD